MSEPPLELVDLRAAGQELEISCHDLLEAADAFDLWTPGLHIRLLLRAAVSRSSGPRILPALCARIAQNTGLQLDTVCAIATLISRNARLRAVDPASRLARRVLSEVFADGTHLIADPAGKLFAYDGRVWAPLAELELERHLLETVLMEPERLEGRTAHATVRMTIRLLKALQSRAPKWERPTGRQCVINCLAGELWIDDAGKVELRPHRPESGLRAIVPVIYDPNATCPRFDQAIRDIFAEAADPVQMTRHMLEVMGYAIQPGRNIPAIVCLVGGGANGKTSLLGLLGALVGADQVYAGSGGALSDRFTLPNLAGRLLYVDDDVAEGARLNDGLLKQMAEDKLVTARRAHASGSETFRSNALPILAMNGAPRLNDGSYGLLRRLLVIPFERRFLPHEQDVQLFEDIRCEELPGVLNRCLEALQRLKARGRFAEPAECILAKSEWIQAANPLHGFLADSCSADPRGRAALGELHDAMISWCRSERAPMRLTRKGMARQLRSQGYSVQKIAGLARVVGLKLQPKARAASPGRPPPKGIADRRANGHAHG